FQLARYHGSERRIVRWQSLAAGLVDSLADEVMEHTRLAGQSTRISFPKAAQMIAEMGSLPAELLKTVVRLPACFVAFDQRPADCDEIVRNFASRWPDRKKPLAVIGVRTSGNYLAPLHASSLRRQGFEDVSVITWRPGQQWLPNEERRLAKLVKAGALALIVDDPPTSGTALSKAGEALQAIGFSQRSVILLMQCFEFPAWWAWPVNLSRYQSVQLPSGRWSVQRQLTNEAIRETLAKLMIGRTLTLEKADGSLA